jgi:hypothetical protein
MSYDNDEAKDLIVKFFDEASNSIENISVQLSNDCINYIISLNSYFNTDNISKCRIQCGGFSSFLNTKTDVSHDHKIISKSKSVSTVITIRVNIPNRNESEMKIHTFLENLKRSYNK